MTGARITLAAALAAAALASSMALAGQLAVTSDGRKVVLLDDGTWQYAEAVSEESSVFFRSTRWGMSRDEVMASEEAEPSGETPESLIYEGTLAGRAVRVHYTFASEKLVAGGYEVVQQHPDSAEYFKDYNAFDSALRGKYGDPARRDINWTDESFRDRPDKWGTALSAGHMSYLTAWRTATTSIEHTMEGRNFRVDHEIEYRSTGYEKVRKKLGSAGAMQGL